MRATKQKFKRGDLVWIGPQPVWMRHFPCNRKALILYSYEEKYGGEANSYTYALLMPATDQELQLGFGSYSFSAWYDERDLTKIGRGTKAEQKRCLKEAIRD